MQRLIAKVTIVFVALAALFTAAPGAVKPAQAAIVNLCHTPSFPTLDISGLFVVQTNRWNENATGALCLDVDNVTGDFTVIQQDSAVATNGGPTSYPSIIKGCHWVGLCSTDRGGMPAKVADIDSMPSNWAVEVPNSGTWNASYDIWFNTTPVVSNPTPTNGQNNGAEIMVWLNHRSYSSANPTPAGAIRPSGTLVTTFNYAGATWDVWVARLQGPAPDQTAWNVISYVRQTQALSLMGFDAKGFMDHSVTLKCPETPGSTTLTRECINPQWYLLSVQAGFEPWTGGAGLKSKSFTVKAVTNNVSVETGRTTDDGRPLVHWGTPFLISVQGCAGGVARYTLDPEEGDTLANQPMTESPAGSGNYAATVPAVAPRHGNTTITTTIDCPSGPDQVNTVDIYIDPSGKVMTPAGAGIAGATVTLYRSTSASGPFTVVPDGSTIMSPRNRSNPDTTGSDGSFGWDVTAGFYKVRAQKPGCVSASNPSQTFVESAVLTIPPPVTNLDLRLSCPGSGLPVQITKTNDWGTGYCSEVKVTNNTAAPVNWNINFTVEGTIYTFWNVIYTQTGNQVNARGVDWNRTLQPGQSTHSVGFCANR